MTGGTYSSEESNWKENLPKMMQDRLEQNKDKLKSIDDHIQQTIMKEIVAGMNEKAHKKMSIYKKRSTLALPVALPLPCSFSLSSLLLFAALLVFVFW